MYMGSILNGYVAMDIVNPTLFQQIPIIKVY
jgi:hypothetical protein